MPIVIMLIRVRHPPASAIGVAMGLRV